MSLEQTRANFSTTNWTLVQSLQDGADQDRARALRLLTRHYWPPVYAYLRRSGRSADDAADLTQSFFADVVLGRRLFEHADRDRGRLRSLILSALKRHLIDQHRRHAARPDGAALQLQDLSREEHFLIERADDAIEDVFDRRWAMAVMDQAIERCEQYFREIDRPEHWAAFAAYSIRPAQYGHAAPNLRSIAEQHGFVSAHHAASALRLVRQRMRTVLKQICAETTIGREAAEREYATLIEQLGG
jgi:DNA-directed RNA polymerase specialized sigma24 family protein